MTTGQALIDAAFTFRGEPYSTAPGRTSPTSGHKDCSGLIVAAHTVATGSVLSANVSSTLYRLCRDEGQIVPYDQGIHIAGALAFKPDNPLLGIGPNGHVAFFTGDGATTIEATPPRVAHLSIAYNAPWSNEVGLLPGIDYANGGQGAATPARKGQHMIYVDVQEHVGLAMEGPIIVAEFNGAPNQYGIPQDAVDYAGTDIPLRVVPGLIIAKLRKADEIAMTPPTVTTVPGDCPPGVSDASNDDLVAELGRRLP